MIIKERNYLGFKLLRMKCWVKLIAFNQCSFQTFFPFFRWERIKVFYVAFHLPEEHQMIPYQFYNVPIIILTISMTNSNNIRERLWNTPHFYFISSNALNFCYFSNALGNSSLSNYIDNLSPSFELFKQLYGQFFSFFSLGKWNKTWLFWSLPLKINAWDYENYTLLSDWSSWFAWFFVLTQLICPW